MSKYSSNPVNLAASADTVYSKLSNLENLSALLEKVPSDSIPEDKRAMFEGLEITHDTIKVPGGPMGAITFRMAEKVEPTLIRLRGEGMPVAMSLSLNISPDGADRSVAIADLDIELPKMVEKMVGGQLRKVADQFGQVLKTIPFS